MYLVTDITSDGHVHEDDLRVEPGPQHAAELLGGGGEGCGHLWEVDHLVRGRTGLSFGCHGADGEG